MSQEVDFYWPQFRLVVEVDGIGHERIRTRRDDMRRDARLRKVGIRVLRFSGSELDFLGNEIIFRIVDSMRGV